MKRRISYYLLCLIFQVPKYPDAQTIVGIWKASNDTISRIHNMQYEANLSQAYTGKYNLPIQKGKVILERSNDSAIFSLFIIRTDSSELIFDGRFGFEVNHINKTVDQVSAAEILSKPQSDLAFSFLLSGYSELFKYFDKKDYSGDSLYWVLKFLPGNPVSIEKIWLSKKSLLPEKIQYFKKNQKNSILSLKYEIINSASLPKPGTQVGKYIETYVLLPLRDSGIPLIIDGRDSLVNNTAPEFILNDLITGSAVKLSDFRGKYVLLDFWEVWCAPCRMSMPHLESLSKEFEKKGLVIIGITKDNPTFAKRILSEKKVTYLNLSGNEITLQAYRVAEIPQYYLIDRDGKIIYAGKNGYEQKLENRIRLLFIDYSHDF
jgi:peroxiredoxin